MDKINNISKIGVISDTHIPTRAKSLPLTVFSAFKNTDLIIHCGDYVSPDAITELETIAPVYGVKGNMDSFDINLPQQRVIVINNKFKLCISHGSGPPFGIKNRLFKRFKQDKPDMVIYGHSHLPYNSEFKGINFFNPGSACCGRGENTVGVLFENNLNLTGEIIQVNP
ncbi:MAG TPA: metallophosphoesterase family protein [Spirochaetota bacterium]|nr:metallophosphoesterase family protein [Spirochaetota bacterium]